MTAPTNQAFFVVGHANWGKSRTLRALTGNSFRVRTMPLSNRTFRVGRMSNDDTPPSQRGVSPLQAWQQRIIRLQSRGHTHLLLTLCPNLEALPFLRLLSKSYRLYFWVIKQSFVSDAAIPPPQIASLRSLGKVEVSAGKHSDTARAAGLGAFISAHP